MEAGPKGIDKQAQSVRVTAFVCENFGLCVHACASILPCHLTCVHVSVCACVCVVTVLEVTPGQGVL